MRFAVMVLGDLGRSPRIQYQALSLASLPADVNLIGYEGKDLIPELRNHPKVTVHRIATPPAATRGGHSAFSLAMAGIWRSSIQALQVTKTLLVTVPRPNLILVQNPPAIPTLFVTWIVARLRKSSWVIDWHNYGYSLVGLKLGMGHPLVVLAQKYEQFLGGRADAHLCVSNAMRADLDQNWELSPVVTVPDRPNRGFRKADDARRNEILQLLAAKPDSFLEENGPTPLLAVTASSWTEDENFSPLLEALKSCDQALEAATRQGPATGLTIVLTGEGSARATYEDRFAALGLKHVTVLFGWLAFDDYVDLLSGADVGLCFHDSSSTLDLPMKIVDMLGAGLPVFAYDYGPCLSEILVDGTNGRTWSTAEELGILLRSLCGHDPPGRAGLDELRSNIARSPLPLWQENWDRQARALLRSMAETRCR